MFLFQQSTTEILKMIFLFVFQLSVRPSPSPWLPTTRNVSSSFFLLRNQELKSGVNEVLKFKRRTCAFLAVWLNQDILNSFLGLKTSNRG